MNKLLVQFTPFHTAGDLYLISERNQLDSCLFNVGSPKFFIAATGDFQLGW
jgi:hypothetical protein